MEFTVKPEFKDIVPTHIVMIVNHLYSDYLGESLLPIGYKLPAYKYDAGYMVLCLDGAYRYASILMKDIVLIGEWKHKGLEVVNATK